MSASVYLLCTALTLGQPLGKAEWELAPKLTSGLELIYRGEFVDEDLQPNVLRRRRYQLETNAFILEPGVKDWQVAFWTWLTLQEEPNPLVRKTSGPASLRMELGRIEFQGRVRNKDKKPLEAPIKGPPTLEVGFVTVVPSSKVGRESSWDVLEDGRPNLRWQVVGIESTGGLSCIKLTGLQQTDDWNKSRADHTAWRRRETLWLHPQLLVAQKVERIIEERDPARETPTHRLTVRYELESHLKFPNVLFQERRQEVLKATEIFDEIHTLARQPAQSAIPLNNVALRLTHLDRPQSAYRKVFGHLKTMVESAQKGETPVPHRVDEPPMTPTKTAGLGQRVPDFAVSSFTQEEMVHIKGRKATPSFVLFYNPSTGIGKEVIVFAKKMSERKEPPVAILAMAVTDDANIARKQHQELKLGFAILDGNGMRHTFGADHTPRFVVIDRDGVVRFAETGWGLHTPYAIDEAIEGCHKK